MKHSPAFLALVDQARKRIRETDVSTIQARLKRGERFILLDVREDHEWTAGHIPSAQHLSKGIIERDIETLIPDKKTEVVLYCGGGYRSALAADNLQTMGYERVLSMDGGFRGWKEAGGPIETPHG